MLRDEFRFLLGIFADNEDRKWAIGSMAMEFLFKLSLVVGDDMVAEKEDLGATSVIGAKVVNLCAGVTFGKVEDVGGIGSTEAIDTLGIISDDGEILMF